MRYVLIALLLALGCAGTCDSVGGGSVQAGSLGAGLERSLATETHATRPSGAAAATPIWQTFSGDSSYSNLPHDFDFGGTTDACQAILRYEGHNGGASNWTATTDGETLTLSAGTPSTSTNVPFTAAAAEGVEGDGTAYYEGSTTATGDITTGDFAIELVAYFSADATNARWIEKRDRDGATNTGYGLIDRGSSDDVTLVLDPSDAAATVAATAPLASGWYHFLAFADRSWASGGRVYVNGALSGTPIDLTSHTGTLGNTGVVSLLAGEDGTNPVQAGDGLAFAAVYDCSSNLTTTASHYLDVAESRFAYLTGTMPARAGNAVATIGDEWSSYTRATVATLEIMPGAGGTGELFTVGAGWPRFVSREDSAATVVKGVLIESAATNLVTHSSALDNAAWTKLNATIGVDAIATPFGDSGDSRADAIIDNTVDGGHAIWDGISVTNTVKYVFSAYIKAGTQSNALVYWGGPVSAGYYFNLTNCTVGDNLTGTPDAGGAVDVGGGWCRLWVADTAQSTASMNFALYSATGTTSGDHNYIGSTTEAIYVFGVQVEQRDDEAPSSLVSTAGATATRNKDVLTYSTDTAANFDETQGSVALTYLTHARDTDTDRRLVTASASATAEHAIAEDLTADACEAITDNTTNQATVTGTTDVANGAKHTCAMQYALNDVELYADNASEGTPDTAATMPTSLTDIDVGQDSADGSQADGIVSNLRTYNVATVTQ